MPSRGLVVLVTGANGMVGTAVCRALAERSAQVHAVVWRAGVRGVAEHVEFADDAFARP